jgi:hypothetical protein
MRLMCAVLKFHRKTRIEAEAKFYSIPKGGKGPVLRGTGTE